MLPWRVFVPWSWRRERPDRCLRALGAFAASRQFLRKLSIVASAAATSEAALRFARWSPLSHESNAVQQPLDMLVNLGRIHRFRQHDDRTVLFVQLPADLVG
jgi:hypothetical protein